MSKSLSLQLCTGCAACAAACSCRAITLRENHEGFLYPSINEKTCIRCGLCNHVCPLNQQHVPRLPRRVLAVKANDDEILKRSSSGGVFSLLAKWIIRSGGIVVGACFDSKTWTVRHLVAESEADIELLCGSKYVQSDFQTVYPKIQAALISGREVLVSGTPCQIAGVRSYLGHVLRPEQYDGRLILVDFACHAIPSPKAWKCYLDSLGVPRAKIKSISFRDKDRGWKGYCLKIQDDASCVVVENPRENVYFRGFLHELFNRSSCRDCRFRSQRSGSDLTLADYWMPSGSIADLDDDKGLSLVLLNTQQGEDLFKAISDQCKTCASNYEDAVRVNPALVRSFGVHPKRAVFFKRIGRENFSKLVVRLMRPTLKDRLRAVVVRHFGEFWK